MSGEWPYVVSDRCPWPERIGLRARLVPALRREYPWVGLGHGDVVVLIEDDPHSGDRDWSCVLTRNDLESAAGESTP